MSKTIRNYAALAAVILMTGVMSFAQAGEATYKAKCQSCHGADGNPNPGIAKMMGVKPASDATVKAHSESEMIATTTDGKEQDAGVQGQAERRRDQEFCSVLPHLCEVGKIGAARMRYHLAAPTK